MARSGQEEFYAACAAEFGLALDRLACAYEADPELRRDLLQEIHIALWRSFALFDNRCSLRTWTYRVSHNTAAAWVVGRMRGRASGWFNLDAAAAMPVAADQELATHQHLAADRLMALVQQLQPVDKQLVLLYLEGLDAAAIAAVTGLTATNVTTKMQRIKAVLARQFQGGEPTRDAHHDTAGTTRGARNRRTAASGLAGPEASHSQPAHRQVDRAECQGLPVEEPA